MLWQNKPCIFLLFRNECTYWGFYALPTGLTLKLLLLFFICFKNSFQSFASTIFESKNFLAFSNKLFWISSKVSFIFLSNCAVFTGSFLLFLLTKITWFFSMSFGPISIRNGMPLSSHSLNFHPGVYPSLSSSSTE